MKTVNEVRANFWERHPEFAGSYRKTRRQNDYSTDIRTAFVDYVDRLRKDGTISERLANRVTL